MRYILIMKIGYFDPFADRLSRDIRNDLAAALSQVLEQRDIAPVSEVADSYLRRNSEPVYREYILNRLAGYRIFLNHIREGPQDTFRLALVLWDQRFFFEVHEVLEHEWLKAEGEEKRVLQGMIRAAGVYIKLESGYREAARKIAGRALPVLEEQREFLARYFNPDKLYRHLKDLTLPPPCLLDSAP